MAYTLNEFIKQEIPPYPKAVLMDLLRQSKVLQLIPWKQVSEFRKVGLRWQTLPTQGSNRKIGGSYTEGSGKTEQVVDTLHAYGYDVLVDRLLLKAKAIENPLTTQTKMKNAKLAADVNYDFINGDHSVDEDTLEGLKKRVANQPARQTIRASATTDSLKVLADAASEHLFLDALHEALDAVSADEGGDVAIFMNRVTKLGVGKVLRRLGLLATTQDQYARTWDMFGAVKLVDIGLRADQATEIISSTETADDAGADSTSLYVVRFSGDDGLHGIQLGDSSFLPYDPIAKGEGGVASQGPGLARRVDTAIGLAQEGRYSVARVYNFKMATA